MKFRFPPRKCLEAFFIRRLRRHCELIINTDVLEHLLEMSPEPCSSFMKKESSCGWMKRTAFVHSWCGTMVLLHMKAHLLRSPVILFFFFHSSLLRKLWATDSWSRWHKHHKGSRGITFISLEEKKEPLGFLYGAHLPSSHTSNHVYVSICKYVLTYTCQAPALFLQGKLQENVENIWLITSYNSYKKQQFRFARDCCFYSVHWFNGPH